MKLSFAQYVVNERISEVVASRTRTRSPVSAMTMGRIAVVDGSIEGRHYRVSRRALVSLVAILLASGTASAQSRGSAPAPAPAQPSAGAATLGGGPDLQGIWDFTMRVGDRSSPGFFALGPVEQGWAGSITMYLTNTLAIRSLTVSGDSVRMIVASREGDVRLLARLINGGRAMEGIVEYHGGARLPMMATRRVLPVISP
jgi:hypothetical protein